MDDETRAALMAADQTYQTAQLPNNDSLPPDGEYQCIIDGFRVLKSKKNGRHYFKTESSVATGEQSGHAIGFIHDMEDPERQGYLKEHCEALGIADGPLADIESRAAVALDCPVLVGVWTSRKGGKEYRNARVRQRLGGPLAGNGASDLPPIDLPPRDAGPVEPGKPLPF